VAESRSPADRTLRIGAAVTVVGLVFLVIALLPLIVPSVEMPGVMWFLAMLVGVGLIIVFVGLTQQARERRSRG
jgi:hypothetical protein